MCQQKFNCNLCACFCYFIVRRKKKSKSFQYSAEEQRVKVIISSYGDYIALENKEIKSSRRKSICKGL